MLFKIKLEGSNNPDGSFSNTHKICSEVLVCGGVALSVLAFTASGLALPAPTTINTVTYTDQENGPLNETSGVSDLNLIQRATANAVTCGPSGNQQKYTADQVKAASNAAKSLAKNGKLNSSTFRQTQREYRTIANQSCQVGGYPKYYGASDASVLGALPEGCKPARGVKLIEWPITTAGSYSGGDPGPDRVLINEVSPPGGAAKTRTYCLSISHRNRGENEFKPCT
ncbi:hypothetical protein MBLNU459_g5521t2 [Dothideomycetes sp. NU459]